MMRTAMRVQSDKAPDIGAEHDPHPTRHAGLDPGLYFVARKPRRWAKGSLTPDQVRGDEWG